MEYTFKENTYISIAGKERIEDIIDIKQYAQMSNQLIDENINLWRERFVYRKNINSILYPKYDIAIYNFFNECNVNIIDKDVYTIKDIYNIILKISEQYADWANSKMNDIDKMSLTNFCKGAIGEYFWYWFLKLHNKLLLKKKLNKSVKETYLFQNICLRKEDDFDFGVDLIGEVEINGKHLHNCIFQCKFYSPESKQEITLKLLQGVHDDGCNNGFISRTNKEVNTFICWLGTDKNVSRWLSKELTLNECVKFIDINEVYNNNSDIIFKEIIEKLKNIKSFK